MIMKWHAGILFSCLLTLAPSSSNATNWQPIKTLSGSKYFIDRASVRGDAGRKEGDKREVKTMISYEEKQRLSSGVRFFSESFVDIFSCANRTRTTQSSIQFEGKMGTGRIVNSHKMSYPMPEKLIAGSIDEHVLEIMVCDMYL